MTIEFALEKISTHRDRFVNWGTVLVTFIFFAGLWTTAPTLKIDLPFGGGAKTELNVGYIYSLGPIFILFTYGWAVGALVSMRRYQLSVINDAELFCNLRPVHLISFYGPTAHFKNFKYKEGNVFNGDIVYSFRLLILFIMPAIVQLLICGNMYVKFQYYTESEVINSVYEKYNSDNFSWSLNTHEISPFIMFTSSMPIENGMSVEDARYTVENSGLNRECSQKIVKIELEKSQKLRDQYKDIYGDIKDKSFSCVPIEFPRFDLAANAWVNLFSLIGMVYLCFVGFIYYTGKYLSIGTKESHKKNGIETSDNIDLNTTNDEING
jgi:hypothetical protein